ncbi:MAG: TIGR02453 family protein [Acidimicrobiia bacterium]
MTRYFTDATFSFLEDLADNNERDWFKANQQRFGDHVQNPALAFIEDFASPLMKISPHLVADPRKVGGSLFRIHRDARFSKDKTPYKTHIGMQFRHVASKDDVHAPGLYLHIEPGASYAGVGLWRPATADAYAIRAAIASDPAGWKRAAHGKRFADAFTHNTDDTLVRVPKGFDPDHPFADDIRRKDFIGGTTLTKKQVTGSTFLADYTALCRTAKPFMQFLCDALGVAL